MHSLFKDITVWRCTFPLRFSFSHNLATRNRAETLIVRIRTHSGFEGYGQALPREYLTGETLDSALASIQAEWWPRIASLDFSACNTIDNALQILTPVYNDADACRNNAAFSAVEIPALDAFCRERNIPAILPKAGGREKIPLVGVISATGPRKVRWMVRALRLLGYTHFKIKVGANPAADMERIETVKRAAGKNAWLAADANQAWEFDEAVERMGDLRRAGIQLVEEPLRAGLAERLGETEKVAQLPVMADETFCTISDAHMLLRAGSPSWWNCRIGKNGGFSAIKALGKLAGEKSINIYMGVLVGETSALAAAGRAVMFGANAQVAEYGFPRVFLRGDPFRNGPSGWNGGAEMPESSPGLGIAICKKTSLTDGTVAWQAAGC